MLGRSAVKGMDADGIRVILAISIRFRGDFHIVPDGTKVCVIHTGEFMELDTTLNGIWI